VVYRLRFLGIRELAVLSCLAVAFATASATSGGGAAASPQHTSSHLAPADAAVVRADVPVKRQVVLVVGDSLVAQSTAALQAQATATLDVRIAGRLGTAPCDWTGGDFQKALDAAHPAVVVFAFAGNAGSATGCVGNGPPRAYPLAELLYNYRAALMLLAQEANAAGATVVFSAPPARNPADPAPPAVPTAHERLTADSFYGFQGVPAIRDLYAAMAASSGGRWRVSDAAALAVSPDFVYTPTLKCDQDDGPCPNGVVAVRAGGSDAIHLDDEGHGAKRYAHALVASALPNSDPGVLAGA
jgi:hypothetical protein